MPCSIGVWEGTVEYEFLGPKVSASRDVGVPFKIRNIWNREGNRQENRYLNGSFKNYIKSFGIVDKTMGSGHL